MHLHGLLDSFTSFISLHYTPLSFLNYHMDLHCSKLPMNRWLGGIFCFGFDTDDTDFIVKLDLNKEIIYSGQSS